MIASILMACVVALLAFVLGAVRHSRNHQVQLESDNRRMKLELERHRETVQSILRELQNP